MKINNLALAATLLTSEVVANPEAQERQALTEQVVGNQVDALAGKVDVIVAEKEAEAERAEMLAETSRLILRLTPEQFEEVKAEIEPDLESLGLAQQVEAWGEYKEALLPTMEAMEAKLKELTDTARQFENGTDEREAANKARADFKKSEEYLNVYNKYQYFATKMGEVVFIQKNQERIAKTAEGIAKDEELLAEKAETAELEKERIAAHEKLRATLTTTMNQ